VAGAAAEGLGLETGGVQLVGDARVIDLLFGGELQNQRHQQALHLHAAGGALLHHLLEEDALVSDVLVDDPESVAAGGDDETLVDLAERAEIGEHRERNFGRGNGIGGEFAVSVEVAREFAGGRRTGGDFEGRRAEIQARRGSRRGAESE